MIKIVFEPEKNRSAAYDGEKCIGQCVYTIHDSIWTIVHTEVESNYGGQGIALKLVNQVIQEARNQNVKVDATCSYAKKILV